VIEDRKLKPGTKLVMKHKGKDYHAKVLADKDAKLRYRLGDGREFKSPSGAGSAVTGAACNGWREWNVVGAADKKQTSAKKNAGAKNVNKTKRPSARTKKSTKTVDAEKTTA
jgi:hypothetical protein